MLAKHVIMVMKGMSLPHKKAKEESDVPKKQKSVIKHKRSQNPATSAPVHLTSKKGYFPHNILDIRLTCGVCSIVSLAGIVL